jgi:molecular chaperone GrpE
MTNSRPDAADRTAAADETASSPGQEPETTDTPAELSLAEDPETVRSERDDYRDRLLRTTAEFENYRKRIDRERQALSEFATNELLKDLLPLVDDLERALAASTGTDASIAGYRAGVELIHKQLLEVLRKRGVTPIESLGADFDPHVHQAVATEVSGEHREGEVIQELRRGYTIGDRLLRPAMVRVASRE